LQKGRLGLRQSEGSHDQSHLPKAIPSPVLFLAQRPEVHLAGVGYGKWESVKIAQTYDFLFSSKKYDDNARDWTEKGWDDADQGDWR
jgi:hypothetical protein